MDVRGDEDEGWLRMSDGGVITFGFTVGSTFGSTVGARTADHVMGWITSTRFSYRWAETSQKILKLHLKTYEIPSEKPLSCVEDDQIVQQDGYHAERWA
jgi:hypothetical protein